MPCIRNAPPAERRRARARLVLVIATVVSVGIVSAAGAQGQTSSSSVKMGDTAILGERPTPDVFFIVPTGRGGNLRAAHRRDYSGEILEPVVKPWLEKDQNVTLANVARVAGDTDDWREALDSAPITRPVSAATEPVRRAPRPSVDIPAAARSRPSAPALPPPSIPSQAMSAPPQPPPSRAEPSPREISPPAEPRPWSPPPPPPAAAGGSGDVPILVPPQ